MRRYVIINKLLEFVEGKTPIPPSGKSFRRVLGYYACFRQAGSKSMKKNLKTPTNIVGKRKHGFRKRMKSRHGRDVLKRRRQKGRKKISR